MKLCAECGKHPAIAKSKKRKARYRIHAGKEYDLCGRCYNAMRNSLRPVRIVVMAAFLIASLFSLNAQAQTTTTVIGAIRDLTGTPVPGGQVTFELRPGGDTTISGNGRFTPTTVTCSINQSTSFSGSGVVRAANVVTVTFTSPHSFLQGDAVTVTGMSDASFNGTFTIATVADTSHVTWAQTAGNANTGGGLISALRASPGPGSCKVTQNTALQPAGTSYQVCLWPLGARTSCFGWYAIGAGPVDLSTAVPAPPGMPIYAIVDTINNQTIGGDKTYTGTQTFQGQVMFPSAFALNGIFSSATANSATTGIFRAANNENALCMRNAGNSANLCMVLDGTNTLKFNGSALGTGGTVTSTSSGNFSPLFNVSVATNTTTPAFSYAPISQNANLVYGAPCGSSGNPSFRSSLCLGSATVACTIDTDNSALASYTDVAQTSMTITSRGGTIVVHYYLPLHVATEPTQVQMLGDGAAIAAGQSYDVFTAVPSMVDMTFFWNAGAGVHTISLQSKTASGVGTSYWGCGSTSTGLGVAYELSQ